jgi:hypothetical protein
MGPLLLYNQPMIRRKHFLAVSALALCSAIGSTNPAAAAGATSRAFDYQLGTWRVHAMRLLNPGAPLARWTHYAGTHTVIPLLSGRANIGVLEISGPQGPLEGLQLRLFNPQTQRWGLSFASGSDGDVQAPSVGQFAGDRGTFLSSERIAGHNGLVRSQTIVTGASDYRDVISYSLNGGATWQPMWIATYVKTAYNAATLGAPNGKSEHGFDFQIGSWHATLSRLVKRLQGSHAWRDYEGTMVERRLWNGRANVGVLEVRSGKDCFESILLRTFNPQTREWHDYGVDTATGSVIMPPVAGRFNDNGNDLYERDTLNGRPIVVRYTFDQITKQSNRFVQAFSADGGATWETNAIVHFTRAASR